MKELKTAGVRLPDSPLVPYPSRSLVPGRATHCAAFFSACSRGRPSSVNEATLRSNRAFWRATLR